MYEVVSSIQANTFGAAGDDCAIAEPSVVDVAVAVVVVVTVMQEGCRLIDVTELRCHRLLSRSAGQKGSALALIQHFQPGQGRLVGKIASIERQQVGVMHLLLRCRPD